MDSKNSHIVIGLMSGTSLDGLDIACCRFIYDGKNKKYSYEILAANTITYTDEWRNAFLKLEQSDALFYAEYDRKIGAYFGEQAGLFIKEHNIENVDFIASHGHTIFHQPEKGITVQAGHGAYIAAAAELPVICDFRSLDVALGGQGAPLVPIGDKLLFSTYDFCLNLGGIANISYTEDREGIEKVVAFDICPANMVLNYYATKKGLEYDKEGILAVAGSINNDLLAELNGLGFYVETAPKSLGKEWVFSVFVPLIEKYELKVEDILATLVEHIVFNISKAVAAAAIPLGLNTKRIPQLIATGGGAFNSFLMKRLKNVLTQKCDVIIPDEKTVKFKEALIFAFLGLLRWQNRPNSLASVTGATKNNAGGAIYYF